MKIWQKHHRWLKLAFAILSLGLVVVAYAWPKSDRETAQDFAADLRSVIVEGRIEAFRALPCVPNDCNGEAQADYVFGQDGRSSVIRTLLSQPGIRVKVYGPLSELSEAADAPEPDTETFVILYYDPAQVVLDQFGHLTVKEREALWWKGYVETRAARRDGVWGFYETPFYFGAHLPFVDEYG